MSIDSYQEAQREFADLVRQEQTRALWFMRSPLTVDIADKNADSILDHIAQKGDRTVWLRARRLKKWRLRNIKWRSWDGTIDPVSRASGVSPIMSPIPIMREWRYSFCSDQSVEKHKLFWAGDSRSQRQLDDVKNLAQTGYDREYLTLWARTLGVSSLLDECL